jgi:hypothetical protein
MDFRLLLNDNNLRATQLPDEEYPSRDRSLFGICDWFTHHLQPVGEMGASCGRNSHRVAATEDLEKQSQMATVVDRDRDRRIC